MIKACASLAVMLVLAATAQASFAPTTSPIPLLRNSKSGAVVKVRNQEITALVQIAEHERQKEGFRQAALKSQRTVTGSASLQQSPVPRVRPRKISQKNTGQIIVARTTTPQPAKKKKRFFKSRKGSVCGVRSIKGVTAPRISGRGACGIANPVKVTEVAGVSLTRVLTVNCTTAKKLDKWVAKSVKPAIGRRGGGLASIQIIGGYSCRTRNSRRGAKLSEHAKGNAVDIAGFKLKDGTIYSVKRDWRRGRGRKPLRKIHKSACGPFGTVLGPNADRHHKDHFHLDVARHRSGSYCR